MSIFDGNANDSNKVGSFCGENGPKLIKSLTNFLLIEFVSDQSIQKNGFEAVFETFDNDCGYVLDMEGNFTSPNYPSPYSKNLNCVWHILAPINMEIKILIPTLELEFEQSCR